jgi:hypothetical protein
MRNRRKLAKHKPAARVPGRSRSRRVLSFPSSPSAPGRLVSLAEGVWRAAMAQPENGRPRRLRERPAVMAFLLAVHAGDCLTRAARWAGWSESGIRRWMLQGASADSAPPYQAFVSAVRAARTPEAREPEPAPVPAAVVPVAASLADVSPALSAIDVRTLRTPEDLFRELQAPELAAARVPATHSRAELHPVQSIGALQAMGTADRSRASVSEDAERLRTDLDRLIVTLAPAGPESLAATEARYQQWLRWTQRPVPREGELERLRARQFRGVDGFVVTGLG